jgi:hypothetical protein
MPVSTQRRNWILVITIEREDKRNALNAEVTAGIDQAMNEREDTAELWCGSSLGAPVLLRRRRPRRGGRRAHAARRHRRPDPA